MPDVTIEAYGADDWWPVIDADTWWDERTDELPADHVARLVLTCADELEDWTGDYAARLVERFHRAMVGRTRDRYTAAADNVIYSSAQCNYETNLSDDGAFLLVDYWDVSEDNVPAMDTATVLGMFGVDDVDALHDYVAEGPRYVVRDWDGVRRELHGHWRQSERLSHAAAVGAWSAATELGARVAELAGETVVYWNAHSGYLVPRYDIARWAADELTDIYRDDIYARCASGLVPTGDGTGRPINPRQQTLDGVPAPTACNWESSTFEDHKLGGATVRVDDDDNVVDVDGAPEVLCPECGGRVELYSY